MREGRHPADRLAASLTPRRSPGAWLTLSRIPVRDPSVSRTTTSLLGAFIAGTGTWLTRRRMAANDPIRRLPDRPLSSSRPVVQVSLRHDLGPCLEGGPAIVVRDGM